MHVKYKFIKSLNESAAPYLGLECMAFRSLYEIADSIGKMHMNVISCHADDKLYFPVCHILIANSYSIVLHNNILHGNLSVEVVIL